jgi:uncharacterized RDD family membrane protein YckC
MGKPSDLTRCPRCGVNLPADTPVGLCPACLVAVAEALTVASPGEIATAAPTTTAAHVSTRPAVGHSFGPYHIERLIGRGGMGDVYEAEHLEQGRRVALKVLNQRLSGWDDRARFMREGQLAASINHPHTVYIFGSEEIDGVPTIAMELLRGGTLKDRVKEHGPLPPAMAVDAILQVIAGLDAMHAVGVLHRDVKPANCFVDSDGTVKVGDFGLSISTTVRDVSQLTMTGAFLGTPQFAALEQLKGDPLDVRADIYSVGATLYYLLTGQPPFVDTNVVRLIERALHERPTAVRAARRDVPHRLDSIVQQCLAKDPSERPPSYGHLTKLLLPYGSAAPAPAPPGLRMLAIIIDTMIMRFVGAALPFLILMQWRQQMFTSAREWLAFTGAHLLLVVTYFGVSEGVWSASPGKMVVGLRVVRTGGQPPGMGRSLARAFILCLAMAPSGFLWSALWPSELGIAAWTTGGLVFLAVAGAGACGIGILFSTARRQNGFAGLHELATQTRVVSKLTVEPTARTFVESVPVLRPTAARVGPYAVFDESAIPGVIVGLDQQLNRRVWIRRAPTGARPMSLARRNVSRPTRLRWLTGSRATDGGWDAYEAVTGERIRRSEQPRSWGTVRGWLQDLAQEIIAARKDGTSLPLDIERVWVTNGRAILLDWVPESVEGASQVPEFDVSPDERQSRRFLYNVAMLALRIQEPGLPRASNIVTLPLHAQELLDDMASDRFDTATAIVERLRSCARKPVTLTRARRCAHLAICAAAPVWSMLFLVPVVAVLLPLLAQSPDALLLEACLRRLGQLEGSSSAEAARERTALETYVVGRFRPLLTESASRKPWFWPMIEIWQPTVQRTLARQGNPSDVEIERAAQQLAGLISSAQRNRDLAARGLLGWRLLLVVVLLLIVVCAVPALVSAFVARGGAVFRLLDIAVVGPDGYEVSRLRGLARSLIAWTPGIAALALVLPFAVRGSVEGMSVGQLAPSVLLLGVFVAGAVFALFNENRGLQDRIVRTTLIPR